MSKKNNTTKATTEAAATSKAATPGTCASTVATIALCVMVTLPPTEKFDAGKGYWQIEIKDRQGQRYSDVYRTKDLEMAHTLAEKIAKDRKLPIVTQEPPTTRKAQPAAVAEPIPMPDPESDTAEGEALPY